MEVTKKDKYGNPLVAGCAYGISRNGAEDIAILNRVVEMDGFSIMEFDSLNINNPGMPPIKKIYLMDTTAEFELLFMPRKEEEVVTEDKDELDLFLAAISVLAVLGGIFLLYYAIEAIAVNYHLTKFIQK